MCVCVCAVMMMVVVVMVMVMVKVMSATNLCREGDPTTIDPPQHTNC